MNSKHEWHPVLIKTVVEALQDVFVGGYYADKVLRKRFRENKQWGSRDRRFLAETVYDMVRWWGFLAAVDGSDLVPSSEGGFASRWAIYEVWKNDLDPSDYVKEKFPAYKDFIDTHS